MQTHDNTTKNQSIDLNVIMKILYKNIILITITTILFGILGLFLVTHNKSFKTEINLYSNDRVLKEINEIPQFSLSSFEFLDYLYTNSKAFHSKETDKKKFIEEYANKISVETEDNSPNVKIKFNSTSIEEGNMLADEYAKYADQYIDKKEMTFLDTQLKLLKTQYDFISSNTDIRTTKDTLTDTLVSRLGYYRLLRNDTSPLLKLVDYSTKPAHNKKLVLVGLVLLGLSFGVLIAFVKEFIKSLDWNNIKR